MLIERSLDRFHIVKRFGLSFIEKVSGEQRTLCRKDCGGDRPNLLNLLKIRGVIRGGCMFA